VNQDAHPDDAQVKAGNKAGGGAAAVGGMVLQLLPLQILVV
jgi:hypothetical protein